MSTHANLILSIAVLGAAMPVFQACSSKTETTATADAYTETADEETADEAPTECDFYTDTLMTITDESIGFEEIGRYFGADSTNIFLSLKVFAIKGYSPVNATLVRIVDEEYCNVTGGSLLRDDAFTPKQVARYLDHYGRSFTDTVVPELDESYCLGFNITINLRPVYATDRLITYAVYADSYTGGAHGNIDFYYGTIDRTTGERLGFDQLVPADRRSAVRSRLLSVMAKSKDMNETEYLNYLTQWAMVDGNEPFTVETFPIYNVGITDRGLAFAYPKYSIAPGCDDCPVFFIPE